MTEQVRCIKEAIRNNKKCKKKNNIRRFFVVNKKNRVNRDYKNEETQKIENRRIICN